MMTFENLKQMNAILQQGEMNSILAKSKGAKNELELFSKKLLEQSRKLGSAVQKPVIDKPKPEAKTVNSTENIQMPQKRVKNKQILVGNLIMPIKTRIHFPNILKNQDKIMKIDL